ncbi:MAG: hypothetical protein NT144_07775 [Bacteroidia bacterium]|nr:hypothetical protein [Bacteroidia bacterium]
MKSGWINERVNVTDWESIPVGEIFDGSTWAETSLMLTYLEIPGLYIIPEKEICVALDNIEAKLVKVTSRSLEVEVYNPTGFLAEDKLMVESLASRGKPLQVNYLLRGKILSIKPGERKIISLSKKLNP